ncbi:hypothetical protein VQ042_22740 [Aurantimonas sp. A2-1-M11]|uniref:hypothetical protein n=1 Tax=Aurantimonas sp. A2-1-M11 TaxID=3113712 RepID=UPI002F93E8F3
MSLEWHESIIAMPGFGHIGDSDVLDRVRKLAHGGLGEKAVFWCFAAANAFGILIGVRFRAPALIVATLSIAILCVVANAFEVFSEAITLTSTLLLVLTMHLGFLIGLCLPVLWRKWADR